MDTPNIIAIAVLVVAIGAIIGIRVYQHVKKNGCNLTIDEFCDTYSDQIIAVLKDVIVILQINAADFVDREHYEKCIISTTIDKIKENACELGIDKKIITIFDSDCLADMIYTIFNDNLIEVFNVLNARQISENPEIYDETVLEAHSVKA